MAYAGFSITKFRVRLIKNIRVMTHYRQILILAAIALAALAAVASARAEGFSTMGVEEISSLIDAQEASASVAVSAKESASDRCGKVSLTAGDMVSKVYGVIDPDVHKEECVRQARKVLGLTPQEDSDALWLESADGFVVDYYGMRPQVSAMARYDDGAERAGVADYGYFFLFPYTSDTKAHSINSQSEFCGSLLQEMYDNGLALDLNTATDDLFEAVGEHNDSLVDVRLLDDKQAAGDGRFILILSVEPYAFTE